VTNNAVSGAIQWTLKDIVTDGTYLSVVNDSKPSYNVFQYTIGGTYVGKLGPQATAGSNRVALELRPAKLQRITILETDFDGGEIVI